ncbi:hypothetical protein DFH06DRAFT_1477829 [Mycena polygramma]|nr:hypothetical protein DFH06DRAFT_1477829 [Mycena polygramma]
MALIDNDAMERQRCSALFPMAPGKVLEMHERKGLIQDVNGARLAKFARGLGRDPKTLLLCPTVARHVQIFNRDRTPIDAMSLTLIEQRVRQELALLDSEQASYAPATRDIACPVCSVAIKIQYFNTHCIERHNNQRVRCPLCPPGTRNFVPRGLVAHIKEK